MHNSDTVRYCLCEFPQLRTLELTSKALKDKTAHIASNNDVMPYQKKAGLLTLFHAGSDTTYSMGGIYAPSMISRKKGFRPIPFAHPKSYQKAGLYLKIQKNGGRFKIAVCNMTGRISSIFCIFYLFALKWL